MTLRQAQRAFTRTRLVEAATRTFEVKGYPAATVEDIVAEAGASRATFYVHFKNKEDVAHAIFDEMSPLNAEAYSELDRAVTSGSRAGVHVWIEAAMSWWDANPGAVLALEQIVASGRFGSGGLDKVQLDAMPGLRAAWGADAQDELRLRLYLMNSLITRTHRAWRIDNLFPTLDDSAATNLVTDLWVSGLELPRVIPWGDW